MRWFFLFLFLPVSLVFASVNSDNSTLYNQALEYYKNKNFEQSYKIFSKIYLDNLSDGRLNFYFGKSAYETGRYNVALAAFERVDLIDSSNIRNKLEMARTYYMLKMFEDAQAIYEEILTKPELPQNIRTSIEFSLSKVSKAQKRSFTYSRIMLDMVYDSNVNYGSDEDFMLFGMLFDRPDERSDVATQVYADVTNIYDIGQKNSFAIKNNLSFFSKNYSIQDSLGNDIYDMLYYSYKPSLLYQDTDFLIDVTLGFDMLELDSKKYLTTYYINPKFEYKHMPTLKSLVHMKYQPKKYANSAQKDLDANRMELSYGLQNILSPRSYIQPSLLLANEKKVRGRNIYVDFDEYKLNINYANQIASRYTIDCFAQARRRDYKDYSTLFSSKRVDKGYMGNLGLSVKVYNTLLLKLKGSYEKVDSNQDRFSYDKYTTSIGIVKNF
ncbi:hypothetical protein [Sulfurimonas sp.]|uniref:hypothetical protein n=1 Tax=Sulfurimonas sp. TaxID=2022749 RepID=UPI0035623E92